METITASDTITEVLERCPTARQVFDRHGLKGCGGEHGVAESLDFFARVHQADLDSLLRDLNAELENPSPEPYVFKESLADYIYRRFFKAGIAVVLSVGALWGAVNLLQIALAQRLLQPDLVNAIHAHAHAMIFGWVGLFVMGFAYQSFPRFKYTTLWRPELANLTLFLMLGGILVQVAAEMVTPTGLRLGLGTIAALAEFLAIALFLLIIFKTARQSMEPRSPYEGFIFAALGWFLVQAICSDVFFFLKVTAADDAERIRRIALFDAPLRDIQLFGFAALIIAGVSQRFVPAVYGLGRPERQHQRLILGLINGSLVLDVVSYIGLVSTARPLFAIALELAYLLMLLWPVLLVMDLGVFSASSSPDRSLKFVRASYAWLLVAMAMMPLFPLYNLWTNQMFAHAYWGAHRHAFTVGFISLMIVGVSSRVVPILAGLDPNRISRLWGPFLLLNAGCTGRVALQILTDFAPKVAYPLIGFTGFIELGALAWWGIELWQAMNLAKKRKLPPIGIRMPLPVR
jgi:hypothetical protein